MTRPRPVGEEVLQDIQVMLKSDASPSSIRSLKVSLLRGQLEGSGGCHMVTGALETDTLVCQLCDPEQLTRPC